MTSTSIDLNRPLVLAAARRLIEAARAERAVAAERDARRWFYLGVETAALEELHPELRCARADDWLDREPGAFREGYMRTTILLAATNAPPADGARLALPPLPAVPPGI